MNQRLDPVTRQMVEDFEDRLDAMAGFYRRTVVDLATDRMVRDFEALKERVKPRHRLQRTRRLLGYVCVRIGRRLLRSRHGRTKKTSQQKNYPVLAVDDDIVDTILRRSYYPSNINPKERRWFDV